MNNRYQLINYDSNQIIAGCVFEANKSGSINKIGSLFLVLIFCLAQKSFSQKDSLHSKLFFTSKEINRVQVGLSYSYRFSAFDSMGIAFLYTIKNLPSWLQYNAGTQTISGKAIKAGQYSIDIIASNADTAVHQRFMLTVYDMRTTNILCLGNSITNGTNKFNSYRRSLWQLLHAGNYNFDMIGSWSSHHMGGEVPNPDFDMDHDGHSGWTAADILNPPDWDKQRGNIHQWLQVYSPGIVLLELGTNEVFQCVATKDAINNIGAIIDILRKKNNGVKIFVAQIPPLGKDWAPKKLCGNDTAYAQKLVELNIALKNFAAKKNTTVSPVIIVDQYTGIVPEKNMYDDIHPNDSGEKIMAERWFKAIRPYLTKL